MVEIKDTSLYDKLNDKIEALTEEYLRNEYYSMLESTYTSYVRTKKTYEDFYDNGNIDSARSCLDLIKEHYVIALKYGIDKIDIRPLLAFYNEKFNDVYPDSSFKDEDLKSASKHMDLLDLDELMADIDKKIAELDAEEEAERKKKKKEEKK